MSIFKKREELRPIAYQKFYDYWKMQDGEHWNRKDYSLTSDVSDWHTKLTEDDRNLIGGVLKSFAQTEVLVGDFWTEVARLFPVPEIISMARCFSYFETIHIDNYVNLNETLNLINFKEFLQDSTIKHRIDYLVGQISNISLTPSEIEFIDKTPELINQLPDLKTKIKNIAISLAVFSAFTEGVMIFSSFAVLYSYSIAPYNLMRGTASIIKWSIRDENTHSHGGMALFNEMCKEFTWLRNEIAEDIYNASRDVYKLEKESCSTLLENKTINTINFDQLENFIKVRLNNQLSVMGYSRIFMEDYDLLKEIDWFYNMKGMQHTDFFADEGNNYQNVKLSADDLF